MRLSAVFTRYAELRGLPPTVVPDESWLRAVVRHTDVEPAGSMRFSNLLLNRLHASMLRSQLSNLMSIPTDCPSRRVR
jgi:alpha-L-rhamnosidase